MLTTNSEKFNMKIYTIFKNVFCYFSSHNWLKWKLLIYYNILSISVILGLKIRLKGAIAFKAARHEKLNYNDTIPSSKIIQPIIIG